MNDETIVQKIATWQRYLSKKKKSRRGRSDGWQLAAKNQQHPPRAPTAPRS